MTLRTVWFNCSGDLFLVTFACSHCACVAPLPVSPKTLASSWLMTLNYPLPWECVCVVDQQGFRCVLLPVVQQLLGKMSAPTCDPWLSVICGSQQMGGSHRHNSSRLHSNDGKGNYLGAVTWLSTLIRQISFSQPFTPRLCSDAVSSLLLDLHLMIFSVKAPPLTAQLPPSSAVHHLPCWRDRLHIVAVLIVLTGKKKNVFTSRNSSSCAQALIPTTLLIIHAETMIAFNAGKDIDLVFVNNSKWMSEFQIKNSANIILCSLL